MAIKKATKKQPKKAAMPDTAAESKSTLAREAELRKAVDDNEGGAELVLADFYEEEGRPEDALRERVAAAQVGASETLERCLSESRRLLDADREKTMRVVVLPHVRAVFKKLPELRSAILAVSQYWNDEANDAVHGSLHFSTGARPDIKKSGYASMYSWEKESSTRDFEVSRYDEEQGDEVSTKWSGAKPDFHVGVSSYASYVKDDERDKFPDWDDNDTMIPLFAAFCEEGSQDQGHDENDSPYALFTRRADGSIGWRVIGQKLRPAMDGVRPEYEGESGEDSEDPYAEDITRNSRDGDEEE